MDTSSINIDFDQASHEWRLNKIMQKNGYFTYRCTYIHSDGKKCCKPSIYTQLHTCKKHANKIKILF